jgi:hypothetical protein
MAHSRFRFLTLLAASYAFAGSVAAQTDSLAFSNQRGAEAAPAPVGRILIGTVPAYSRVDGDSGKFYELYRKLAPNAGVDSSPALSGDEFRATIAGWAQLKVFTLPFGDASHEEEVLIPASLTRDIGLPTNSGTFAVHEAGDLLVARTNADGFYVVEAVLCREGPEYAACARAYRQGIFDAASGMKLGHDGATPAAGNRIDINTYRAVEEEPQTECISANIEDRMRAGPKVMDIIPTTEEKEIFLGCDAIVATMWASR